MNPNANFNNRWTCMNRGKGVGKNATSMGGYNPAVPQKDSYLFCIPTDQLLKKSSA
jgi:hypothetical protein